MSKSENQNNIDDYYNDSVGKATDYKKLYQIISKQIFYNSEINNLSRNGKIKLLDYIIDKLTEARELIMSGG